MLPKILIRGLDKFFERGVALNDAALCNFADAWTEYQKTHEAK